jgi:glycosyltransferase involved in cell wall biosynthesis
MRIAQVAPLFERVPPQLYGGTERVVSYLTEELVRAGHDVTLFSTADSQTRARLVPVCPIGLWRDPDVRETLPHQVRLLELVFRDPSAFDLIHFHTDYIHFPLARRHRCPTVTTLHGELRPHDVGALFDEYRDIPVVSISDAQRLPIPFANWRGTVYHGLPRGLFAFRDQPDGYLAFVGRLSPEKGVERAIEVARRSGRRLKIAGKIYPEEREYYLRTLLPLIESARGSVEIEGEIDDAEKNEFLGRASAVLFPISWREPFGLVMIEALACGTPVIAWRCGSVPEVLEDGLSGFIVESVEAAVQAVDRVDALDRAACREVFERRFDAARMAQAYLGIYEALLAETQIAGG